MGVGIWVQLHRNISRREQDNAIVSAGDELRLTQQVSKGTRTGQSTSL